MQGHRHKALALQHFDQVAALLFGIAKSDRADRPEMTQQLRHRMQALAFLDLESHLPDLGRRGQRCRAEFDFLRLTHELRAELGNTFRVGGREQQGLALFRRLLGHGDDVVEETHVKHPIGFIEHQRVQLAQIQAAAFEMVHDAARRADGDMGAKAEAVHLRLHRRAAAQRQDLDVVSSPRQPADFLRHLVGQLARRAQDQGLHVKARGIETVQQRQRKSRGLAAARLGLSDQIMAGQGQRQARRLDRCHLGVAELNQVGLRGGAQRELGKGLHIWGIGHP